MSLRRAFIEGRRIQARHTILRPRSSISIYSCATYQNARVIHQNAKRHPGRTNSHKPDPLVLPGAFHEELETFHAVVCAGGTTSRAAFDRLRTCFITSSNTSCILEESSKVLLEESLLRLCGSPNPHDHNIVQDGLLMSAQLLGMATEDYAMDMFSRLMDKRDVKPALEWLWVTGKIGLQYALVLTPWHRLLEVGAGKRNEYIIANALTKMQSLKVSPTEETGRIILAAVFRPFMNRVLPPSYDTMKHLINLFHSVGIPYDEPSLCIVKEGYTDAEDDIAQRVELLYTSTLARPGTALSEAAMHSALVLAAVRGTRQRVFRLLRRFLRLGLKPSDDTLSAVLGDKGKIDDYDFWCATLQINGGPKAAAKVMKHLITAGGPLRSQVIKFYRREKNRKSYIVSADMLNIAIRALLSYTLTHPSEQELNAALAIYYDFIREDDASGHGTETLSQCRPRPDARAYQRLLRTLTRTHNRKHLSLAISLVEDMQRFEVELDPKITASIIIILMRAYPTPTESFEAYRLFGKPPAQSDKPRLNEEGYIAILDAFCKLKTWPAGIPSTKHFFQIVADMPKYGLALNHKAYTIILSHLARLATKASSAPALPETSGDVRTEIAKSIARVHNHLTIHPGFTPDAALWNQLMDAYQRAGCFTEACGIWETLFATRTFTNTSVSIIIDACAFHQAYEMAVRVFTALVESGYCMNVQNWNTLLECLCRLGKIDEAMKVLCLEMPGREDGIEPDKESVRILLKFAAKRGQEREVRSKIRRFLPKLYFSMQNETS